MLLRGSKASGYSRTLLEYLVFWWELQCKAAQDISIHPEAQQLRQQVQCEKKDQDSNWRTLEEKLVIKS